MLGSTPQSLLGLDRLQEVPQTSMLAAEPVPNIFVVWASTRRLKFRKRFRQLKFGGCRKSNQNSTTLEYPGVRTLWHPRKQTVPGVYPVFAHTPCTPSRLLNVPARPMKPSSKLAYPSAVDGTVMSHKSEVSCMLATLRCL